MTEAASSRWRLPVVLLGLLTIGSFGVVLYGFAAFVSPIERETGWSNAAVSAAFTISTIVGSVLSLGTGRLLDRVGARPVMASTLILGSIGLWSSSYATDAWQFVLAWGVGGAIVSAGLLYQTTMAVTTRIAPVLERPSAFTWLTVIGGLSSPIAFPLAGAMIEWWGWRGAVRGMVAVMIALATPAIVLVRGDGRTVLESPDHPDTTGFDRVRTALSSRLVRRWLVAASLAMAGLGAVQVHHVGAIEAAGVSIGTASLLAGIRGLLSLPGRAGAASLTNRIGAANALRVVYVAMSVGTVALVLAGSIAWVWLFVVVTGLAFGSVAPLQGLYAAELYGHRRIGALLGMQQLVTGTATAVGPLVLGLTVDATGGYGVLLVTATVLQLIAAWMFREPRIDRLPDPTPATTP